MPPLAPNSRIEYLKGSLDIDSISQDPFVQFQLWFNQAAEAEPNEPNACALATVGLDLKPSVRMVLLKHIDPPEATHSRGLIFFSNYLSHKGRQLAANNQAALLFYWGSLERQVRIEGQVVRTSREESDNYFSSRPRDSQLGSAASTQSEVAPSREELTQAMERLRLTVGEAPVPRPPHWGGYRLIPQLFEFWQGRENRLHDRIRFKRIPKASWEIDRLWP